MTPLQRLHGRKDNTPLLEFGEKILYMPAKPAGGGKWEPRLHPGVFVEMLNSSSEAVVVTEQGLAIKTCAANVRRIPESERWDADRMLGMWAVPWFPDPRDVLMENKVARTYLRKVDFEQWDLSEGCPGAGTWGLARAVNKLTTRHVGEGLKAC